jgi:hypothetical protein
MVMEIMASPSRSLAEKSSWTFRKKRGGFFNTNSPFPLCFLLLIVPTLFTPLTKRQRNNVSIKRNEIFIPGKRSGLQKQSTSLVAAPLQLLQSHNGWWPFVVPSTN